MRWLLLVMAERGSIQSYGPWIAFAETQHMQMASIALNPTIRTVKQLAESPNLSSIPSNYAQKAENEASEPGYSIPIVDLSLLASGDPKAIQDLDNACKEWGFFMIVNHGIPEELVMGMLESTREFFNLPEDEKPEFQPKDVVSPIRYGTSFNTEKEQVYCWRDFLKLFVHPHFHCPDKPESLRNQLEEYCGRCRDVVSKLLQGVSRGLGLEEGEAEAALGMASTQQIFIANLYPRCPNPELAMGLPTHSDHGLFTLLVQNGVDGLQIQRDGRWIDANPVPNSILVNTGDHLEIFSNGRYKSVLHRAVVNGERTRISIAMANGPSRETVVMPAASLAGGEGCGVAYVPISYGDYIMAQQSNQLKGKSVLRSVTVEY